MHITTALDVEAIESQPDFHLLVINLDLFGGDLDIAICMIS